jgi:Protein of unknown function (DUF2393)
METEQTGPQDAGSQGPDSKDAAPRLAATLDKPERNWLPMAIAAAVIVLVAAVLVLVLEHGRGGSKVTPIAAAADPYSANLALSDLAMSESTSLSGGKVTYLDGKIANKGSATVTGVSVQVLFRDYAHEVAQNETDPLMLIRMREPYIDVEPVSSAPLKPGAERDFRLIFDQVKADWDGAYPELRIVRVETR